MKRKVFILEPRSGLCNQLNCIAIGLVLGLVYDRDIYFNGFQNDYLNEEILCEFNKIIDIEHLNTLLKKLSVNFTVLRNISEDINKIHVLKTDYDLINNEKDIYSTLKKHNNLNYEILNLKNPISTFILQEHQDFYNYIKSNIKFDDKFIEVARLIKNKYELNDYCCIHIRMENDAIEFATKKFGQTFEEINDAHKQIYTNEFENIKDLEIKKYVCTSLNINDNKNNLYYKIIKKNYDLIDKNDIINDYDLFKNDFKQRELYGIIDYIIAIDSSYFIGCDWSSFSDSIINNHKINEKHYNILNIWDICSKL